MKRYLVPLFIGLSLLISLVMTLNAVAQQPAWQSHPVAGQRLTALAIDPQGRPWFGTSGGTGSAQGAVIYGAGLGQRVYTTADGLVDSNQVTAIAFDNENEPWFGTDRGVSTFDGQTWRSYTTTHGLISNAVNTIAADADGIIWFGTNVGISTFDGQTWRSYTTTHGLISNAVNAVAIDDQGHKWFGTDVGVSQFDGTTWRSYTTTHGLAFSWVNAIAVDGQGDKWFATQGGGISRFDGRTWTTYTAADGLASNIVYSLAVDQAGVVWAGTSGGVSQFDGTTWTTYTTADGLLDNPVSMVAIDPAGHKWFGYGRGTNYDEPDARRWVTEFDDSRWQPPPVTMPAEITTPLTVPVSALTVTPPFLVDEPAGRMYVRATGAGSQPSFILVLTPEGQPLTTYNLTGELALDEDNGWLYVDQADNQGLAVINTRTDRLQTIISLPEELENSFYSQPPSPPPLAEPTTNRVIAVRDNVVYLADPESGTVVETLSFNLAKANSGEKITDIYHTQYDPSNGILYLTFITYNCTSAMGGDCDGYTTVSYDLQNKREITRHQGDRPGQALAGYLYSGYHTCIGVDCNGRRSVWREGRPWRESTDWADDNGRLVFDPTQQQFYEISPASSQQPPYETPFAYVRIYDAQMTLLWQLTRPNDALFIGYDALSKSLRFWDQGEVRAWPIQPPSPEPLLPSSPPTTSLRSLAVSPAWPVDRTLIGTWDNPYNSHPVSTSQEWFTAHDCNFPFRLYFSLDEGQSWARSTGGLAGSCGLTSVVFSPSYADDQTMLGSVPGLGPVKSTDGGQLWQPAGAGIMAQGIGQILFSPNFSNDQTAFVRADTWYRSTDGGQQWQPLPLPEAAQDSANRHLPRLILSPEFDEDQTMLVVIDKLEQDELYISQGSGEQWIKVGDLPTEAHTVWVAPLFGQWQTLFASGTQEDQGLLYRSTDGGRQWQVVLTESAAVGELIFAPDIEQNRPIFARTGNIVYHSTDGGQVWQALELPAGITPTTLAISPTFSQDQTLFIGTDQGEVLTLIAP
jgi:hypothetical protein